ncbi:MAG: thioredoxin domain-containing protein [Labilithrix sp.]|nr:thioredoxin domain-containing protein [Labilithrix sp.]
MGIREEMAATARVQPGAVTVVFFTDFQCPFCRRTHAALAPLLAQRRGKVRLVLRHVPLRQHPDARTAARAVVCFESIVAARTAPRPPGVEVEELALALMSASDLSEAACEALAEEHGVARDALRRCLAEPATDARIERDLELFDAVQGDGVPLLFIGRSRLEGAQSSSSLEAALDNAALR